MGRPVPCCQLDPLMVIFILFLVTLVIIAART
jgi:preprotein translocase subunit Sec61beta